MDRKLVEYQRLLRDIFTRYDELLNRHPKPNRETIAIFDETNNHYLLHTMGWQGDRRVWNTIVYVRLRDDKFWIEEDGLEHGIATDLLEAGVPNKDIVLAFHPPKIRLFTEFAVG